MKKKILLFAILIIVLVVAMASCAAKSPSPPTGGHCERFSYEGYGNELMYRCIDKVYGYICFVPGGLDGIECFELD